MHTDGTLLFLGILVLGMIGSLVATIVWTPRYRRPRGSSRFPDPQWVDPSDVLCWGDPRGEVVHGLRDGRGGTYSVTLRRKI